MKINEVIQMKRKELNMTQSQLAEKLDVSDKTISRWELGTVYPNVDAIPKLAVVLGISINELFGDNNVLDNKINFKEQKAYHKIVILKIFLLIVVVIAVFSILLSLYGSNQGNAGSIALIAYSIFLIASISFFINRHSYCMVYKEKYYINEYKYYDGILTSIVILINGFMFAKFIFFTIGFFFLSPAIFTTTFIINFFFLKNLDYQYNKKVLLPLIITGVFYLALIVFAIISSFYYINAIIIAIIILDFLVYQFACLSLILFIK